MGSGGAPCLQMQLQGYGLGRVGEGRGDSRGLGSGMLPILKQGVENLH